MVCYIVLSEHGFLALEQHFTIDTYHTLNNVLGVAVVFCHRDTPCLDQGRKEGISSVALETLIMNCGIYFMNFLTFN